MNTDPQRAMPSPNTHPSSPAVPYSFVTYALKPDFGRPRPGVSDRWELRSLRFARGSRPPLAEALRYEKHGHESAVWMYNGLGGAPLGCLTLRAKEASTPTREFEVYSPEGAQTARISFRPGRLLPWPRRSRWTLQLTSGERFVGKVGTWYGWTLSVGLSPLWVPLWLVIVVCFWLVEGPRDSHGKPRSIRWSGTGEGWAMTYSSRPGFRLDPRRLDFRIAYAQALAVGLNDPRTVRPA